MNVINMEKRIQDIINKATKEEKNRNFKKALDYYNSAFELARKSNLKKLMMKCHMNLGVIKKTFGKYNESLKHYLEALRISESIQDSFYKATSIIMIGNIYFAWQKYEKAIEYYELSININKERKDFSSIANALANIGKVYFNLGKNLKAFEYFQDALKFRKKANDKWGMGNDYNNIGMTYFKGGNYQEANKYFDKAYKIWKDQNFEDGLAYVSNNVGNSYLQLGEYNKAINKIKEFLKFAEKHGPIEDIGLASNNLGVAYSHLNNIEKSNDYFNRSLKIFIEINDLEKIENTLLNIGVNHWKLKNFNESYKYLTRAIEISENLVGELGSEEIRTTYRVIHLNVNMILTKVLIDWYFLDNNNEHLLEALKFLEMSKAREIIDKFERGKIEIKNFPEHQDLILKERELIQQIMELQGIVKAEIQNKKYKTPSYEDLVKKGKELRKLRKDLLEKCKDPGLIRSVMDYDPIPDFKTIFDKENVVVWEFLYIPFFDDYKDKFHIIVWDGTEINIYESNMFKKEHIIKLVKGFYDSLSEDLDFDIATKYLSKIKDILSDLIPDTLIETLNNKKKLILIPHDITHLFPWEIVNKISLKIPIVRNYSLGILRSCMKREEPNKRFLLIANPNFNIKQLDLPGADFEIESISSLIKNIDVEFDILKHENAKESNFINKMKNPYGLIHFAGHGVYNLIGEDSWMSGLLFYNHDGYELLTITDLINQRFNGTPLFILSACETAKSEFLTGDELMGIIRGLTLSGATSIIATNWLLSDKVAPYFMKVFYENFINGKDVCESLFNARKEICTIENEIFKDPIFWAVYTLYGNPFKKF